MRQRTNANLFCDLLFLTILFFSRIACIQDSPIKLLNKYNFHVIAPYMYGKFIQQDIQSNWGKRVFVETAKSLYAASGKSITKKEIEGICAEFVNALKALKEDNTQVHSVVVDKNFAIIEGAHQVGIHLLLDKDIEYSQIDEEIISADMQDVLKNENVEEDILDYLAFEYCKVHPDVHCVIVWPKGIPYLSVCKKMLSDYGQIIYEKSFTLKNKGARTILKHIHDKAPHVDFHYPYYFGKEKTHPIRAMLFQNPKDPDHATECKKKIRKSIGLGNWIMHVDDNNVHSCQTAKMIFSNNSIYYMNHTADKVMSKFHNLYKRYAQWISKKKVNRDNFCIDHGAVLSVFGIREAGDLDFVHKGYTSLLQKSNHSFLVMEKDINCHNACYPSVYPCTVDDIIYNPTYHFYYLQHKVMDLRILMDVKKLLNRPKDKTDFALIKKHFDKYV